MKLNPTSFWKHRYFIHIDLERKVKREMLYLIFSKTEADVLMRTNRNQLKLFIKEHLNETQNKNMVRKQSNR